MASLGVPKENTDNAQWRGEAQQTRGESSRSDRNEHGQFAAGSKAEEKAPQWNNPPPSSDVGNMLRHIEQLEGKLTAKDKQLLDATQRVEKFSARTREGMQSALDSLMKKWMDACETKDDKCKEQFKNGMEKLVQNSAEENGVWQMMVAASALHERQEHDLGKLRGENTELKHKIDGQYATSDARTGGALGKRKAEEDPDLGSAGADNLWTDFAKDCGGF
jgi:hypothetical protein